MISIYRYQTQTIVLIIESLYLFLNLIENLYHTDLRGNLYALLIYSEYLNNLKIPQIHELNVTSRFVTNEG